MWPIPIPAPGIFRKHRTSLDLTRKLIAVVGDPHLPFFRIQRMMPTLTLVNSGGREFLAARLQHVSHRNAPLLAHTSICRLNCGECS